MKSFLLMGQSNMAGRGSIKEVAPIQDSGIKMLRNGRWQNMSEPIHFDRPFAGVGPAASFALAFRNAYPEESIGLIPCADGGSTMEEWMPGTQLYLHALMQSKLALNISEVAGILWHQGETDCSLQQIEQYHDRFLSMMEKFREEAGLQNVPVLIGGLDHYLPDCKISPDFVNALKLDAVLKDIADSKEDYYYITAEGLMPNSDQLHFNAVSQRLFGLRYFEAFNKRRSLSKPLDNETEELSALKAYADVSAEEKIELLKKQVEEGRLSRHEYARQVNILIGAL